MFPEGLVNFGNMRGQAANTVRPVTDGRGNIEASIAGYAKVIPVVKHLTVIKELRMTLSNPLLWPVTHQY